MDSALVTGASGFIGLHFVERLRSLGIGVTCLVREATKRERLEQLGCHLAFGDVADRASLVSALESARPDNLFHLAGLTKAIRRQQLYEVNQDGTRNLLHACRASKSQPVAVIVSTLAASGPAQGAPRTETDEPAPVSEYGRSKLAGERAAADSCEHVPITIVRPPIVFGPRDRGTLEMFRTIARTGIHPVPPPTGMSVSWIHVDDLSRALIALAQRGRRVTRESHSEGVYFAAADEHLGYAELGKRIGEALGRKTWAVRTAKPMIWTLAAVNELGARLKGQPSVFNFDKAREATAGSWICSGEKLRRDVGFVCKKSLTETLCESADWYKHAGWL